MSQMAFDEEQARRLESTYQRRDFQRRRGLVHEALGIQAGERVLDVGCGPGFYLTELAGAVGSEGRVVGVDASPDMVAMASHRARDAANVAVHQASATALPVEDSSFDAALSVQVLEFVAEVDTALAEVRRALRPGGRLVVWDVDWSTVSWHSGDPGRMARVLEAWDGHLAHPSLPRTLAARLRRAGFEDVAAEGHAFVATEPTPESYGFSILPGVQRYVAGLPAIGEEQAAAWAAEQRELGQRGEFFFACLQCCFTARRAA